MKFEELKLQQDSGQIHSSSQKQKMKAISPDDVDPNNFICITESQARQQVSLMIGEKVIGKIFNDNLNDFNDN